MRAQTPEQIVDLGVLPISSYGVNPTIYLRITYCRAYNRFDGLLFSRSFQSGPDTIPSLFDPLRFRYMSASPWSHCRSSRFIPLKLPSGL